jgi:hypothetical protein
MDVERYLAGVGEVFAEFRRQRPVAIRVPGGRPVRTGHRRLRRPTPRWCGCATVLRTRIVTTAVTPVEVVTDRAAVYPAVVEDMVPRARHNTERHANNRVEAHHSQLKRRLRPMRGLKTDRGARTAITGHTLVQNIRRGSYELAVDEPVQLRVAAAFTELAHAI